MNKIYPIIFNIVLLFGVSYSLPEDELIPEIANDDIFSSNFLIFESREDENNPKETYAIANSNDQNVNLNLDNISENSFKSLCENFNLQVKIGDERYNINCKDVKWTTKDVTHGIEKREAPEEGEEGSGNDEPDSVQNSTTSNKSDDVPLEIKSDVDDKTQNNNTSSETKPPAETSEDKVETETTSNNPSADVSSDNTTIKNEDDKLPDNTTDVKIDGTNKTVSEDSTKGSVGKKGRKLGTPTDTVNPANTSEVKNNSTNETINPRKNEDVPPAISPETEAINKEASAINNQTDKNSTDTKTGESTDLVGARTKDTSILIFLFVAVVIVVGGAFAYNFYHKRGKKTAVPVTEQPEVQPSTHRNNTQPSDLKHENEMKPLIKKPAVNHEETQEENEKDETDNENPPSSVSNGNALNGEANNKETEETK